MKETQCKKGIPLCAFPCPSYITFDKIKFNMTAELMILLHK